MEPIEISLILSILSAAATAIWTVWTWTEQQEIGREEKKEKLSAAYVNPFLLAAESLQYRLVNLVDGETTLRRSNYVRRTENYLAPLTVETLYRFALYFGWENYLFRYSPYTSDRRSIELSQRVVAKFIDMENFTDEYFLFSISEQSALGKLAVRSTVSGDREYLSATTLDVYGFEEELNRARQDNSPLWRSPGVAAAIEALERFASGEPLAGRERLRAILARLLELVEYLEREEGFSVAINDRDDPLAVDTRTGAEIAILHKIPGRLRLRVPRLRHDDSYAEGLRERILALSGVEKASVNRLSGSLTVYYSSFTANDSPEKFLVDFIERETIGRTL